MARRKRMDRDMARAVAFDRLAAKADKNNDHSSWLRFTQKSNELKSVARKRMAQAAAVERERKLFERDLKKLGFEAAVAAAKERREASE